MISRRGFFFIGAAILGVIAVSFWGSNYPSRVTIINASGAPLHDVVLEASNQRIELGTIDNGATRSSEIRPGDRLVIRFDEKRWTSTEKLEPAQSLVLFVYPNARIEQRSKIGTINGNS
jgi:hypothetical protein